MTTYKAKGYVLGNYWGGGQGGYPTREYFGNSVKEIRAKAKHDTDTGAIDSGMGYESIIGAVLNVCRKEEIQVKGKFFTNTEQIRPIITGKLTKRQRRFLNSCLEGRGG